MNNQNMGFHESNLLLTKLANMLKTSVYTKN